MTPKLKTRTRIEFKRGKKRETATSILTTWESRCGYYAVTRSHSKLGRHLPAEKRIRDRYYAQYRPADFMPLQNLDDHRTRQAAERHCRQHARQLAKSLASPPANKASKRQGRTPRKAR